LEAHARTSTPEHVAKTLILIQTTLELQLDPNIAWNSGYAKVDSHNDGRGRRDTYEAKFAIGAVLFLSAEFWRDWFPPTTWTERSLRLLLVLVSLGFLGASLTDKAK
jgi:hypothetical protein